MSSPHLPFYYHSPSKGRGQIQVILGPMFSGKSTELLRRIRRYQITQRNCLVIKYAHDNRYSDDSMATHDKQVTKAVKATRLLALKNLDSYSVIGVDEGQFFPDIVQFCDSMSSSGKTVIVAALDGTFERKPFGAVLELIPIAETVVKLSAVCNSCHREAAFTKRLGFETAVEVIGGTDKYMAACRSCFSLSPSKQLKFQSKDEKVNRVRIPFTVLTNEKPC
ncbi:thymidine kinase, cytosolic-like [Ciona intestinalis]